MSVPEPLFALDPYMAFVDEAEFTNRKRELAFFRKLASEATRRQASSYAIIARKGMGKTSLMLELYRQLFTQQKEIVPFFISFAEYKDKPGVVQLTLEEFISKLFVTFVFQYVAFKTGKFLSTPQLPQTVSKQKELIASLGDAWLEKEFATHFELLETGRLANAFDQASAFAPTATLRNGEAGLVLIDEFQVLTEVYDKRYESFRDITPWFQKPAEVRWCPMVISGSAVSLVVKTVMGGLLARRFGPYYLEPFSAEHSLEYAYKLANSKQVQLTESSSAEIHRLTGGNPYYIWCLFNSIGLEDSDLSTSEKVEKLYTFETTDRNGKIRKFWDEHFEEFADKINDEQIGLQCLYQLAVAKEDVRAEEIAAKLNAQPEKVRRVLKNLEQADLIERLSGAYYHNITDPVLTAYIAREYTTDIVGKPLSAYLQTQLASIRKQMGSAAKLLGEAAELYTRHLLMSFSGQEIDAAKVFGLDIGKITLPSFKKVEHRTGVVRKGEMVEFDLLAGGEQESWLVEVRYRKEPVRVADVEKFLEKLKKIEGWQAPTETGKRLWFFSRSGFDTEASKRLQKLGILHCDIHGFNALCRAVKIGEVPV